MPRYFLDLPEEDAPLPWDPHAGPRPERADTRYFGGVFRAMEALLRDREIDVYLTWDTERLPEYGERVVAVVLGDEVGRIPRYEGRIRAVFKSYGTRPASGARPVPDASLTGLLEMAQYAVRCLKWLPGGAAHAGLLLGRRLRGEPLPAPVAVIPLGTYNQVDLPLIPIEARPTDIFFAGSLEHDRSLRNRLGSPKTRARHQMLAAVEQLGGDRPDLRTDLRLTAGFSASESTSGADYSRALMDSRICLAPRGTSVETFRVLEGLRCGCVVVSERLPPHWFYEGSPVLQLDRWSDLDHALRPILDDPEELRRLHAQSLVWWRDRCSEEAVGHFLAERLNAL